MSEAASPQVPTSRRILAGYFTLAGLYTLSAALIWGVNTLFLLDAGLSFFEVFVANAAFSAGMVVFEVPTGVVADTLGRACLVSALRDRCSPRRRCSTSRSPRCDAGVVAFALVSVFMGLGFTFYSGAMEAWLVDALKRAGTAACSTGSSRAGSRSPARPCWSGRSVAAFSGRSISRFRTSCARCCWSPCSRRLRRHARPRLHPAPSDGGRAPRRGRSQRARRHRVRLGAARRYGFSCSRRFFRWGSSCGPSTRRSRTCSRCSTATRSGSPGSSTPASRSRRSAETRS